MNRSYHNNFNRIITCFLLFIMIPYYAMAQEKPRSIEGGRGVFFTQAPQTSKKGNLGLKLTSYYHSENISKYNSNASLMKVAAAGEFGLSNRWELQGMVSTFAEYHSKSNNYQTGFGIGKIGLKYSLPSFKNLPISHAIKLSLKTPGGHLFVDSPTYPFDSKAYSLEAIYMASMPISYRMEGLFNIGFSREDLQNNYDLSNQLLASIAMKWQLNSRTYLLADVYSRTLLDSGFDLFKDYLNISAGVQYALTPKLGLEVGFMHSLDNLRKTIKADYKENWQLLVGLNFSFDTFIPDYDNDGIDDRRDLDLDTPEGWAVDGTGIPLDSDRDGVPDAKDQEILSIAGADVDYLGIAKDSDYDGVPNGIDIEENTLADAIVDFKGRTIVPGSTFNDEIVTVSIISETLSQKSLLRSLVKQPIFGVYFDFGSSELPIDYNEQLDQIGEILVENQGIQLEIIGFADSIGTNDYNKNLSFDRAKSVRNYLSKKYKITIDRLPTTGYGEYASLSHNPNYKAFPLALHRRVAFRIIEDGLIVTGLPKLNNNKEKKNSSTRITSRNNSL